MHDLLFLLAATVAFSLSHAVPALACTPERHTNGQLSIYYSYNTTRFRDRLGSIDKTPTNDPFGWTGTKQWGQGALFEFFGCPDGPPFHLFCVNCGSDTGFDVAATKNTAFDSNGEPDDWLFFNYAPAENTTADDIPNLIVEGTAEAPLITSTLFTWDQDGTFIRPVTYNKNFTRQPYLFAEETDANTFLYSPSVTSHPGHYIYTFRYRETPDEDL